MRALKISGGAFALLATVIGLAWAQTKPETDAVKGEPGTVQGAIVRMFKDEKLIELKIEKLFNADKRSEEKTTPRQGSDKMDKDNKMAELREGQIIYVHVADCRVIYEKG